MNHFYNLFSTSMFKTYIFFSAIRHYGSKEKQFCFLRVAFSPVVSYTGFTGIVY